MWWLVPNPPPRALPRPPPAFPRWAELWSETENFNVWQVSHRLDFTGSGPINPELARSSSGIRQENSASIPGGSSLSSAVLTNGLLCGSNGRGGSFSVENGGVGGGVLRAGAGKGPPRSGVRAFTYNSGDTYTGAWNNGRRHGIGVYEERATGNSYEVRCLFPCLYMFFSFQFAFEHVAWQSTREYRAHVAVLGGALVLPPSPHPFPLHFHRNRISVFTCFVSLQSPSGCE